MDKERILFVDDDEMVLSGVKRRLHRDFALETALGAEEGLRRITANGPFAVVVSDLKMPLMGGIEFFKQLQSKSPDTVRILLTGFGDLEAAVRAINDGHIFRFLTKPCPLETLTQSLDAALRQYRLVMAERELLERTLQGAITSLNELLGLTHPMISTITSRVRRLMTALAVPLGIAHPWEWETAAMLFPVGCLPHPSDLLGKLYRNEAMTSDERAWFSHHPGVGARLIGAIPRLERVSDIVARHVHLPEPIPAIRLVEGKPLDGAWVLSAVLRYDLLSSWNPHLPPPEVVERVGISLGRPDPRFLELLRAAVIVGGAGTVRALPVAQLRPGMVLDGDVLSTGKILLLKKGEVMTQAVLERLQIFSQTVGVSEPVQVIVFS